MVDPAASVILLIYGVIMLFSSLIGIGMYVLSSIGIFSIARRRGIDHYSLAWVPIARNWVLGCIADQFDYVTKGVRKKQRLLLLWFSIAFCVIALIFFVVWVATVVSAFLSGGEIYFEYDFNGGLAALFGIFFIFVYVLFFALSIANSVFLYIAFYKLFKSCDPDNAVLYLVLSIVINVTLPFFLFFCRNKDFGMPPPPPLTREQVPASSHAGFGGAAAQGSSSGFAPSAGSEPSSGFTPPSGSAPSSSEKAAFPVFSESPASSEAPVSPEAPASSGAADPSSYGEHAPSFDEASPSGDFPGADA